MSDLDPEALAEKFAGVPTPPLFDLGDEEGGPPEGDPPSVPPTRAGTSTA